ncbi:MAG: hypothetical protein IJ553_02035 [Alloprevotella sp.]|nr:hypothetical protein [Alloprevotella sp.]
MNGKILFVSLLLMCSMKLNAQPSTAVRPDSALQLHVFVQNPDSLRELWGSNENLHIVHLGDSHVRGQFFPAAVRDTLLCAHPHWTYSYHGINGATCVSFLLKADLKQLLQESPDLIIVSFGTNESHDYNLTAERFAKNLSHLIDNIFELAPKAVVLLTTPPGSYWRRYGVSQPNPRTRMLADEMLKVAKQRQLCAWDMNALSGGDARWWYRAGFFRPDKVHYTKEGYRMQGSYLAIALLNFLKSECVCPTEPTNE